MQALVATPKHHHHHATLPFQVVTAGQHDIPALVDIYVAAFKDDFDTTTMTTTLPECPREFWVRDLLTYTSDPSVHVLKAVQQVNGSEVITAWALWTLRSDAASDSDSDESDDDDDDVWWADEDGCEDDSEDEDEDETFLRPKPSALIRCNWDEESPTSPTMINKASIERKPHMYLEVIATSPEDQRRGAETFLLEHVLIEADELGLEVHTEATSLTAPLYRGFGFEDRGCIGLSSKAGLDHLIMGRIPDTHQRLKHGVGQKYY